MKKSKSYFGNRFKSAVRGFRAQRSAKKELAAASLITSSEFEVLEPRVLLSGVGKAVSTKQWTDSDGDKVVAKIVGKGAQIQVDVGDGKGLDAANINIVGDDNGALSVVVTPVGKMTAPVQTKTIWDSNPNFSPVTTVDLGKADNLGQKIQTQWYNLTPGYTNIGSITAEDSVAFGYEAPNAIASINLSGVVVPVIDLGTADVGNINVSTGKVAMVDALMLQNNNNAFTPNAQFWTANLPQIDVFDITAGSIDQINLAGHVTGVNNFMGTIKLTDGGLGHLTGTNSTFDGHLIFEGASSSLGNVVLGGGFAAGSTITAAGNFTLDAHNFGGVLEVGGHLNLQIVGTMSGTIIADGGISGLRAGTTDGIIVNGGQITGQLISGANIADITFNNSRLNNGTIEATGNIGTIRFDGDAGAPAGSVLAQGNIDGLVMRNADLNLGAGALLVSAAKVTSIDVANGSLTGALAVGEIGDVLVRGGDLSAKLVATGDGGIGNVTVELGRLTGALFAQGGDIGDVTVLADNPNAAISGSVIAEAGSIRTIDATNVGGGAAIGGGAVIFADQNITAIDASSTGGTAIGSSSISANGTLGPVTAVAYGGAGNVGTIDGLTLVAPTIGNIEATSVNGIGINNSSFISTTGGIGSITGTGLTGGLLGVTANSAAGIGSITGTATKSGDGIGPAASSPFGNSSFVAQNGNIGTVTGKTSSNAAGDRGLDTVSISASGDINNVTGTGFTGTGIYGGSITSLSGSIQNITGSSNDIAGAGDGIGNALAVTSLAGSVGNITGKAAGTGNGLNGLAVNALTGIGTIKGSAAQSGIGINDGDYTVTGPAGNITAVIGETNSGTGIAGGATFKAVGGQIQTITATPTGAGGKAVNDAVFQASTFGNLAFSVTNLDGGYAVNKLQVTAINGNIGDITVNNDSLAAGAYGINNSQITAEKGNIGAINVTTDGKTGSYGIGGAGGASQFKASGNIGAVTVTTTGNDSNGIQGGTLFDADTDNSGAGDITSVTVKVQGVNSIGITGASTFEAQNIGAIDVQATNIAGGDAINNAIFDAAGNIASVFATTAGTTSSAIDLSGGGKFEAGGNITGEFKATVTSTTGGSVFIGRGPLLANKVVDVVGNVGSLTITNASTETSGNGLENVKINIDGTLGAVAITTVGGTGMVTSSIDPTTIASVTITSTNGTGANEVAIGAGSDITATVSIGAVTITGDVAGTIKTDSATDVATTIGATKITGNFSGTLEAGTTIGAIEITGQASGNIVSGTEKSGNVTSIKAGSVNGLTVTAGSSATKVGTIGAITITGDRGGNQAITVDAYSGGTPVAGGTIGAIEAKGITTNGTILTVTVGPNAINLGAVTVDVAGTADKANATLTGGNAGLATLGGITADGNASVTGLTLAANSSVGALSVGGTLTTGSALAGVKSLTSLSVGSMATITAPQNIGAGGAGSSVGAISIGTDITYAAGVTDRYTFRFLAYNATPDAVVAGTQNITANAAPTNTQNANGSSTGGGLWFQLI